MTKKEFLKKMGLRIRKQRRAAKITQTELAKAIGKKSAGYICDIEKGRRTIPIYTLHLMEEKIGRLWE